MNPAYEQARAALAVQPRTWLITGVAGFIGSNLLEALLKLGQNVVGIDNFSTGFQRNLELVQAVVTQAQWSRFSLVTGDIQDAATCRSACRGVDFVLHHAAMGSVPRSIESPDECNRINVDGFVNILLAARDARVNRFIYASSSAVYGDSSELPKRESEVLGAMLSPYAASKYINEIYAGVFGKVYGMETIGLRYFNVYGQRQDPRGDYAAVIPNWIAGMLRGEAVFINGDGENTRDYCHVEDVVQANILAATVQQKEAIHQVYNVGIGEAVSLLQLHACLRNAVRQRRPEAILVEPSHRDFRPGDIRHSVADIDKARRLLGFNPTRTVEAGLTEVIGRYIWQG